MRKILVVGQTPPPYHGQAIMIQNMLDQHFTGFKLFHARMAFSKDIDELGKFSLKKVLMLFQLILNIIYYRIIHNTTVLYYAPSGPKNISMYRDFLILNLTRWLFKKTIFHFHAAGISEKYETLSGIIKKLYEKAYFSPDISIRQSIYNPEDGKILKSRKEYIIPCGLEDHAANYLGTSKCSKSTSINIIFVGAVSEKKGILILLKSCRILAEKDLKFHCYVVGKFESLAFQEKVKSCVNGYKVQNCISFLGVQTGEDKYITYSKADILCFPTFFESESFGLVLLEAMQFKLPVVATRWRGIPSIVEDKVTGFLVPIKDPITMAEKLEILIRDKRLRDQMGAAGRRLYCQKFTAKHHYQQMEKVFTEAFMDSQAES